MIKVINSLETQLHRIRTANLPLISNYLSYNNNSQSLFTKQTENTQVLLVAGFSNADLLLFNSFYNSQIDFHNHSTQILELRGRIRREKFRNIIKRLNIRRYSEERYNNRRELIRRAYSLHGLDFDKLLSIKHSK